MEWNQSEAKAIRLVGTLWKSEEVSLAGSSLDNNGIINGVWFGQWQMLRFAPEDCVVQKTLVYGHVKTIKGCFNDTTMTVIAVRLSETAEKGMTDFRHRLGELYDSLNILLNSTSGFHLFGEPDRETGIRAWLWEERSRQGLL